MKLFSWLNKSSEPEIGKTISWKDSIGMVFKVLSFDAYGTVIDSKGNVKAKSTFKPYGYLIVETLNHEVPFKLPIIHKDDFLLAASVFHDHNLSEQIKTRDLLVTYRPKLITSDGMAGIHHALHYVITPLNTLNSLPDFTSNKTSSNIEPLFIQFVWEGEIRVQINLTPSLT
jgi:hypothetical protein